MGHVVGLDPRANIDRGGLPLDLDDKQRIVLSPARPASCEEDWSVWLWIDDAGQVTAVNLLVPSGKD